MAAATRKAISVGDGDAYAGRARLVVAHGGHAKPIGSEDIRLPWLKNSYHVATLDNDKDLVVDRVGGSFTEKRERSPIPDRPCQGRP